MSNSSRRVDMGLDENIDDILYDTGSPLRNLVVEPGDEDHIDFGDDAINEAESQALIPAAATTTGPHAAPAPRAAPAPAAPHAAPQAAPQAAPHAAPPAATAAAVPAAAPPVAAAAGAGPAPAPAPAQRRGGDGSRRRGRNARGGERPARGGERHARGGERPARSGRDARGGERPARGGAPPPPPQGRPRQAPPRQAAPPQPQEELRIRGLADPVAPASVPAPPQEMLGLSGGQVIELARVMGGDRVLELARIMRGEPAPAQAPAPAAPLPSVERSSTAREERRGRSGHTSGRSSRRSSSRSRSPEARYRSGSRSPSRYSNRGHRNRSPRYRSSRYRSPSWSPERRGARRRSPSPQGSRGQRMMPPPAYIPDRPVIPSGQWRAPNIPTSESWRRPGSSAVPRGPAAAIRRTPAAHANAVEAQQIRQTVAQMDQMIAHSRAYVAAREARTDAGPVTAPRPPLAIEGQQATTADAGALQLSSDRMDVDIPEQSAAAGPSTVSSSNRGPSSRFLAQTRLNNALSANGSHRRQWEQVHDMLSPSLQPGDPALVALLARRDRETLIAAAVVEVMREAFTTLRNTPEEGVAGLMRGIEAHINGLMEQHRAWRENSNAVLGGHFNAIGFLVEPDRIFQSLTRR
ncbi:MAG: hypothetical protein Q9187_004051 [Circinaria calcarea]